MSKIYRLRVLIDTTEDTDVFRDIELLEDTNFQVFHEAIQEAFGFDGSEMASFYMSNEDWDKGDEIPLMDISQGEQQLPVMNEVMLSEKIEDEDQRILYVFDFLLMWCFYIEVVKIEKADPEAEYPRIVLSYGEAPDQYSKEPSDLFGAIPGMGFDDDFSGDEDEDNDYEENLY
tara:strand:+ start:1387 stop:1908 length:522 start_codon:yes stop_codon:yes gene_type:complete